MHAAPATTPSPTPDILGAPASDDLAASAADFIARGSKLSIPRALDALLFHITEISRLAAETGHSLPEFKAFLDRPDIAAQLQAREELNERRFHAVLTDAKTIALRTLTTVCASGMVHADDDHLPLRTRLYFTEIARRAASLILRFSISHDSRHLNPTAPNHDHDNNANANPDLIQDPDFAPLDLSPLDGAPRAVQARGHNTANIGSPPTINHSANSPSPSITPHADRVSAAANTPNPPTPPVPAPARTVNRYIAPPTPTTPPQGTALNSTAVHEQSAQATSARKDRAPHRPPPANPPATQVTPQARAADAASISAGAPPPPAPHPSAPAWSPPAHAGAHPAAGNTAHTRRKKRRRP